MIVGAVHLRLRLPENHSLKGKRQVVKSIVERLQTKFGLAAAEVESNELWQIADIGFACVSNSQSHAEDILTNALRYIEDTRPDIEIIDIHRDLVPFE